MAPQRGDVQAGRRGARARRDGPGTGAAAVARPTSGDRAGRAEGGVASLVSVLVLAGVLVAAGVAAGLLLRVMTAAEQINDKAAAIAESGRGINIATDSVIQLQRTNEIAASILASAEPLEDQLTEIADAAGTIDEVAGSIDDTAGAINDTAGQINTTAGTIGTTASGINARASEILGLARQIDEDARRINENLDATISLARAIQGDTGNIADAAWTAHRHAACIDQKVGGQAAADGDCDERGS